MSPSAFRGGLVSSVVGLSAGGIGVGLIGTGAVGSSVCSYIRAGAVPGAQLTAVLVRSPDSGPPAATPTTYAVEELLRLAPAVVVEAASHQAVRDYGEPILAAGVDLVVVSTGALVNLDTRASLLAASRLGGGRLRPVSGAIGGLDALRAARVDGLESVCVEQRKPAHMLLPASEADGLEEPLKVFEGTVIEAVRLYPRTTNVLAAVALAGVGAAATRATIVADRAATGNFARVSARGSFGKLEFTIDNLPSENPRTSRLTALSVISELRYLLAGCDERL